MINGNVQYQLQKTRQETVAIVWLGDSEGNSARIRRKR